jgi:TldD protein
LQAAPINLPNSAAMSFDPLAERALDVASARGAEYADVRFETDRTERIEVRNGVVASLLDSTSRGYGVRALVDGAWGFAAGSDPTQDGVEAVVSRAVEIAKAGSAIARIRIGQAPANAYVDSFATPIVQDPHDVPLGRRVALLLDAERALHVAPEIKVGRAWIDLWTTNKYFYSSIGSKIAQEIRQTGSGVQAMAVGGGDVQRRTYPGDIGLYKSGGWEIVESAKLLDGAPRVAEEAVALLRAPQSPSGTLDVILGGSQVSLQMHESCGHPAELDRVMGWEANFSGVSFLDIAQLGRLKYGSDLVTIVVDNTIPEGLATVGYDDEGTRSGSSDIVRNGVLVGYEMSNDTARTIGRASNGCVRAQSWEFVPMIRMCNLNFLPGSTPFEHLFDDVKDGIYMESNRSWSIDDHRLNFQFGCEIGWEIKNGKRGRMLKNPTYAGVTPQFWNSCDAVADARSWVAWGTPNCGKGEPMQTGRTAQCASPARFRNVRVGVGYDA